ncbi:MAG: hypothetical protein HKO65_09395 [Gemmatimonadetes bacterium]|nr:hypothetical protein [Gemmatimonadota bacterium]
MLEKNQAASTIIQAEIDDVSRSLELVRKKKGRHALWALLGISPAAVIPAIGLMMEGSETLLVVLVLLVTITQGYGWAKNRVKEKEFEETLRRLTGEG